MEKLKKLTIILMIITILQSYFGILPYVMAYEGESNEHNYFTEILIRKNSENGEIVANLLSGSNATLELNQDYYLCIRGKTPEGNENDDDGRFTMQLGDGKPNGLEYINIPGQSYKPGAITSDVFSDLLEFEEYDDIKYGSSTNVKTLKDGKLTYKIKNAKMNNSNIFMAFGFKIDETYWCNTQDMLNAISFSMSNENGIQDSGSLNIHINKEKQFHVSCTDNGNKTINMNARVNAVAQAANFGFYSNTGSAMLYDEIGYTITYPKDTSIAGISFSTVDMKSTESTTYGKIKLGEEIDNGNGTFSKKVTIGPGQKSASGTSTFFAIWTLFNDNVKNDSTKDVVISNMYYLASGTTEKKELKINNQSNTWTIRYKVANTPEIVDKTIISPINRYAASSSTTGIYNWNIGRDENDLLRIPQLLSGANIKNDDSVETHYEKTVKANYNITNENVIVNLITIPVGKVDGEWKNSVLLKYTGITEDNQIITGEKEIKGNNIRNASNKTIYYAAVRAQDVGLKGFKSVEADIGKLGPGQSTSNWTSYSNWGSNFFAAYGYCTDSSVGNRIKCTYEIVNTSDTAPVNDLKTTGITDIVGEAKASFTNDFTSGMTKENSSIVAGNSITLANKTIIPYSNISSTNGNTPVVANPVIILKLPKGMNFSNLIFEKGVKNDLDGKTNIIYEKLDYQVDNISYLNTTEDGTNIYKITFNDKNLVIGEMANDRNDNVRLRMSITFGTSKNVTTQVYDMNDLINITSERDFTAQTYSTYCPAVDDVYGVNNGNKLAGTRKQDATVQGISIQRLDSITVDNAISIKEIDGIEVEESTRTWDTYDESNRNSISYIGLNTKGEFRLKIENPSSSVANNLKMIIPIPKEGQNLGTAFTKEENKFNMLITPKDIGDYTYKYIKINAPVSTNTIYENMDVTENVSASEANAILLEKALVGAGEKGTLYFDFEVTNDQTVSTGDFNCWRNNFEYTLDGFEQTGSGSYVAAEVATCKITGTVFDDVNGNGKKDDEENVMPNISVVATDSLGRVQFTKTDENGTYLFENVREDDISIAMEIKEGTYIFNGVPAENGGEIYNNVTPSTNKKKATSSIHATGEEVLVNASVNKVFTITYDKGVGVGVAPAKQEYLENATAIIATPPSGMIDAGSDFVGWTTTKLATADDNAEKVEYRAGDVITVTEDITLYAAYVKKELKITYDYRGGGVYKEENGQKVDISPEFKYVTYGLKYNAKDKLGNTNLPSPTREGWKFIRWELPNSTYGSGSGIGNTSNVTIDEDTTLRAVWYKLRSDNTTVQEKLLTETTLDEPLVCVKDDIYVINMTTNYGYKFELEAGTVLPKGITFDAATGSFYGTPTKPYEGQIKVKAYIKNSSTSESYYDFPYTVNLKLDANTISLKNEIDPQGYISLQNEQGTITLKTTVTGLKEGFNVNETNKVTYKATSENGTTSEIGEAEINSEGIATFEWNVTNTDVGKYTIEAEIKDLKDYYEIKSNNTIASYIISLQELEKYEITFDPNGHDFEEEIRVYAEGTQYGKLPAPKVQGYTFKGWYDGTEEDSNKIEETDEITGEKTVYAHFVKKEYSVKYETGIETTVSTLEDINFNQSNLIPTEELNRPGYTLTGWSLKEGNGNLIKNTTKYSDLVENDDVLEITLVANWTENNYFITYDANGGSCGATVLRVYYNNKIGDLEKPSRIGYDFINWVDENNEVVTKDTVYLFTKDTKITAVWTPKTGYTIHYNTEGGNEIESATNVNWEKVVLEGIQNPTKQGSDFLYWTYAGKKVTETDTYGELAKNDKNLSVTLNAVWDSYKYNVTLEQGTGYKVLNSDRIEESPYGSNYIFEVKFDEGHVKGENFKVTVNDVEVQLNEKNKYTITNITENKVVKVSGVVDARRAEGQILVDEDKWTSKDTNIVYDIYHKQVVDVVISGSYNYGTKPNPKIEYAIVKDAKPIAKSLSDYVDETTLTWKPYTGSFQLNEDGKYIIYAKLTAENGAITYINTNGVVVDMSEPVIHTLTDGGRYCGKQTIEITDGTAGVASVTVNEKTITPNSDGKYTLPTEGESQIVVVDKAGNSTSIYAELNADHTYNLKETINPTCTEDGKKIFKCVICNHEKEEKIDKLGHDFGEWYTTLEPTEKTKGKEERKCSRCDEKEERAIPVLQHEHNYSQEFTIDKEATCTEKGEKSLHCACGSRKDITEIPALEHSWGEWTEKVAPTEENSGLEERECTKCHAKQENILAPLNHTHNYDTEYTVDKEPTCTEKGEKSLHCSCGSRKDITEIPMKEHTFTEWTVKLHATEAKEGLEERECTHCHIKQQNILPKLNHEHEYSEEWTIDKEPTCTEDGEKSHHCICGDKKDVTTVKKLGHNFGEWEVTKEPTESKEGLKVRKCTRCDEKEEEILPKANHVHKFSKEWTIDKEATCTEKGQKSHHCECGEKSDVTEIKALGHDWEETTDKKVCKRCKKEITKEVKPEENKPETKPEENKPETKPEENKPETKPEENKSETNPEENKPETNPEENKPETNENKPQNNKTEEITSPVTGDNIFTYVFGFIISCMILLLGGKKQKKNK